MKLSGFTFSLMILNGDVDGSDVMNSPATVESGEKTVVFL